MPANPPRQNHAFWEPSARWSVPLFRLGSVRFAFSYLVFVTTALIIAGTVVRTLNGTSGDLVAAVAMGGMLWMTGWAIQVIAYTTVTAWIGWPTRVVIIGLFGIQLVPRRWPPSALISVGLATCTALLVPVSICWLIGSRVELEPALTSRNSFWIAPSVGATSLDSIWLSAAWLMFVQAVVQLYPLSHTIGRHLLAAAVVALRPERRRDEQLRSFRRILLFVALATMVGSIGLLIDGQFPAWAVGAFVGIAVWISSESREVPALIDGLNDWHRELPTNALQRSVGQWMRDRERQRRARKALRRERDEAADADRLDEVLTRLHQRGADALNREDRKLLRRISERVRRQRDAEDSTG